MSPQISRLTQGAVAARLVLEAAEKKRVGREMEME